jgi:hypothetical protein
MKFKIFMILLLLSVSGYAKEPKRYERGTLLKMDSVECGIDETSGKNGGELDSAHKKNRVLLCQEYILQGEQANFRIRPRDEKHTILLVVGAHAEFRIEKDRMLLRMEDTEDKERVYTVVSMTQRELKSADTTASK